MSASGNPCERCKTRIKVLNSVVLGTNRIRYLGCPACGWRPADNKIVVPLRYAPPRPGSRIAIYGNQGAHEAAPGR